MAVSSACWPNWAPSTSDQSEQLLCEDWPVCDLCICYHSVTLCCVCVCVYQVSEGPDVVRDGRPLPVEAFPGSPVSPGDRSWDALDRPQPHRLLPQQSQSTFFLFSLSLIYLMNIQKSELSSVMKSSMQSSIFSEHLFMLHFHWLKKHACICQLIAEEGEQKQVYYRRASISDIWYLVTSWS